jgi:outer membrane protein
MRSDSKGLGYRALIVCMFLILLPNGSAWAQEINYHALTLEDCLALAKKQNPVLGASREKVRELEADYQAARSMFFPRLVFSSYYVRLDPDRLAVGGAPANQELFEQETFSGLSGKQTLFDGLKTYYSAKAAGIGKQAQEQEVRRTANETLFTVTEAYYRMLEAKEDVAVAGDALRQRRDFAKLTEAFFKAGKATRLDSLRARAQVVEAEQATAEAENAVLLAREILVKALGLGERTEVDIQGQLPQQADQSGNVESLWQEALQHNPEIRSLTLAIEQNQVSVKAAQGGYFPEISLQGSTGIRHRDIGGTEPEWLAGIFLDYPLFEGGATKAQVARTSSQKLQLLEKKRDRISGIKVDLMAAWKDQETARLGILSTRQIVEANEEAYAGAEILYRYGKATGLDVLQAQVDLTASRFRMIQYRVSYEIARVRIRQIIGSGSSLDSLQSRTGG